MNQPQTFNSADAPIVDEPAMSLDDVLSRQPESIRQPAPVWPLPAVIVGTIEGIAAEGAPLVDFEGNRIDRPLPARSTGAVDGLAIGSAVALLFENGDLALPI